MGAFLCGQSARAGERWTTLDKNSPQWSGFPPDTFHTFGATTLFDNQIIVASWDSDVPSMRSL
jgi:hypothetical protein